MIEATIEPLRLGSNGGSTRPVPECRICGDPIFTAKTRRTSLCRRHRREYGSQQELNRKSRIERRQRHGMSAACAAYRHIKCRGRRYVSLHDQRFTPCWCDCHEGGE